MMGAHGRWHPGPRPAPATAGAARPHPGGGLARPRARRPGRGRCGCAHVRDDCGWRHRLRGYRVRPARTGQRAPAPSRSSPHLRRPRGMGGRERADRPPPRARAHRRGPGAAGRAGHAGAGAGARARRGAAKAPLRRDPARRRARPGLRHRRAQPLGSCAARDRLPRGPCPARGPVGVSRSLRPLRRADRGVHHRARSGERRGSAPDRAGACP